MRTKMKPIKKWEIQGSEGCEACLFESNRNCLVDDDDDPVRCSNGTTPKNCPLREYNLLVCLDGSEMEKA